MNRRRTGSIPAGIALLVIFFPVGIGYLIWLACQRSADNRAHSDLLAGWDAAIAQMAAAERGGDLEDAARWEAKADALYVEMTGQQPEDVTA